MNLNELMKMLKMKGIMPNHVTKSQIWSVFKSANADHSQSHSSNTNQHEMDFSEFMDCMRKIHDVYKDMKEDFRDEVMCAGGEWGGAGR
jgi:Ca2+-binding EF-hand superfamily protein